LNKKIVNVGVQNNYRIIAISDVHGHHKILEELISKIDLKDDDFLVFIGDFINKGLNSYKTYELIRKLSERKNTVVLKGNHEKNIQRILSDKEKFASIDDFLKNEYYETIIHSLLRETKKDLSEFATTNCLYDHIHEYHSEMINFISNLPIIAQIDEFRFVHGGYNDEFCLENDEVKFLKYDNYNELSKKNENKVVVGHWPTCNLRSHEISNDPFYNDEKNIIFIDGGIGVHSTGELNAFIIEKDSSKITYDFVQHNNFRKRKVDKRHIFTKEDTIYVNYPDFDLEVIQEGESMTRCIHCQSKMEFSIFNSLLHFEDGKHQLKANYINNFLNVEINEEVDVCIEFEDCVLVKYKNEFGWLLSEQLR